MQKREPLYYQIKNDLINKIKSGIYSVGGTIPTEPELMADYGTSRGTVRRALFELQTEEYIVRRSGKRTYVANNHSRPILADVVLGSFSDQMRMAGIVPSSQILEVRLGEAGTFMHLVCGIFLIDPSHKVFFIKRLRMGDGVPLAVQSTYLLPNRCPGILDENLSELFRLYSDKYGISLTYADEHLKLETALPGDAILLNIHPGDPVIVRERTSFDQNDEPFEVLHSVESTYGFEYRYRIVQERTKSKQGGLASAEILTPKNQFISKSTSNR